MGVELHQSFSNPFAFLNFFRGVCILDMDDKEMFLGVLGTTQECKFNIVFTCERVNRIRQSLMMTATAKKHIGRNISRIREMRGMEQETLAEILGVSQQKISLFENAEEL